MTGSKVLQFVLLMSFGIFPTHALDVLLTDGKGKNGFNYETEINVRLGVNGMSHYAGCHINKTYAAQPATTKVIVYIRNFQAMKKRTLKKKNAAKRLEIAKTLSEHNYELLYLAVNGFRFLDERLIAEFLLRSIEPNPHLPQFQIDTIGEKSFNLTYPLPLYDLLEYQEDSRIFGGNLKGELRFLDE